MPQFSTNPSQRRRKPLWLEALIVVGATGVIGVIVGLLPRFQS